MPSGLIESVKTWPKPLEQGEGESAGRRGRRPSRVAGAHVLLRDGEPVRKATGLRYELTPADLGQTVTARVTWTRPGYRALALEPKLLLLDEPLAGLATEESLKMIALIGGLAQNHAILLVEHDMDAVFRLARVLTVMVNVAGMAAALYVMLAYAHTQIPLANRLVLDAPVVDPRLLLAVKQLQFSWTASSGATHYRLMQRSDGAAGFSQGAPDAHQGLDDAAEGQRRRLDVP